MRIAICASIQFTDQIKTISDELIELGQEVVIPDGAKRILDGENSFAEYKEKVNKGEAFQAKLKHNVIKNYYKDIKNSDAILVLNLTKKDIPNYIGGNTFLEMGFAYVLEKKIFVYNPLPEMHYSDELITFQPVVINGDLTKIE